MASVSEHDSHPRRRLTVKDSEMAFVDTGEGEPVVFLHGNPTSSYIWRNIIPHAAPMARCLAPDLIGMGASGRNPRGGYRLADQIGYLDDWFEQLALGDRVTLVMQDWGVVLGFDWARRHPQRVRGMVHMEGIIRPMQWEEWPQRTREFVARLKSPEGEKLVLEENAIVEKFLTLGTARTFSEAEMATYRQPYLSAGTSRQPTLDLAREIPLGGEPKPACAMIQASADWLVRCDIPKLLISARPGLNLTGAMLDFCRSWPNQREVVVDGIHFLQEDAPQQIGTAIVEFLRETNRPVGRS